MIYLDNGATTFPKPKCVYDAITKANTDFAFNAGRGSYNASKNTMHQIDEARSNIASFINANSNNVIFTSSATEALNSIASGICISENDNVFVSPFEHNSVIRTLVGHKANIHIIPFDKNTWALNEKEFADMLAINKPKAVFVSHISNVTGYILPYEKIFEIASKYNTINVLDCAQSYGIINPSINNINYIVFAGHKSLYATFGVGGFIKLKNDTLNTFMFGGTGSDSLNTDMPTNMPEKYEAGSHNSVAISILNTSIKWLKENDIYKDESKLTKYLIEELEKNSKIRIFIPKDKNIFGIVSFAIDNYDSNDVASILNEEYDICVRSGYHCAPYIHDFIGSIQYGGTVRVSVGAFNTIDDINNLIEALKTF